MNRKRIRFAGIMALLLMAAWVISFSLLYALGSFGQISRGDLITEILIYLSTIFLCGAFFFVIFGVWGPIAGRCTYDHLLSSSQREYLKSFSFWRFFLNIES